MADWSKPALGDLYEDFLQFLKDRDADLATMFAGAATNVPVGAVRWNDTNKRLEKWSGSAWTVLPIGVTGGGTGATTVATARSALGAAAEVDLTGHTGTQSGVHGSTNTPTANRLPQYDASGRLKSNAPSASNDVARKAETDSISGEISAHAAASAPHSGHATQADLAAHAGSTSNPHAVTAAQAGAPPVSRSIVAGNGLTGGGDLSADRSLVLGVPSTLSGSTSNGTTSTSHTHALSMATQAQAEAGADSSVLMSPLRARQAIVSANPRCLVYLTTDFAAATSQYHSLYFNAQDINDKSIHNPSINNDRLTVPSGYTRARVFGQVGWQPNSSGARSVQVLRNGALMRGLPRSSVNTSASIIVLTFSSAIVSVATGQYFTLQAYQNSGGTLNILSEYTWFGVEFYP